MTSTGIYGEAEKYAEAITATGIRATLDPRRVDPPCALIVPTRASFQQTLACDGFAPTTWNIHLLAPGVGDQYAMQHLSTMAASVLKGMQATADIEVTSYRVDSGDAYPCITITFETPQSDWLGVTTVRQPAAANT